VRGTACARELQLFATLCTEALIKISAVV